MGFDSTRFIGEIDEEFQCSICTMVLENAVQTPCDHLFCSECIKNWLAINKTCTVDRNPLSVTDLKPINRTLQNLLSRLEMKCDFDSQGCNEIVKLESLQRHLANCEYNPDARIVCDKGCNLEIGRGDYRTSNCFTHLANNHEKEIVNIIHELSNQKEHFDRVVHLQGEEIKKLSNQLRCQRDQLEDVISLQNVEIRKLSDEVHQLRRHQDISKLNHKTNFLLNEPTTWESRENIKSSFIQTDQTYILETEDKRRSGFIQSFYAMEPRNASFKVQVVNGFLFYIGLSFKGQTIMQVRKWFVRYFASNGTLIINNIKEYEGQQCKIGDIIELGIKFPLNFDNDGNASVELSLSINERVVAEKLVKMPNSTIHPTIEIYRGDIKIKYFGIENVHDH